jgi:pyruvate,orthophosphate dikinase
MRFISFIGKGKGNRMLLGNKGFHLNEMAKEGLPVPEGFTIKTDGWARWRKLGGIDSILEDEIREAIDRLEFESGRYLNGVHPLLVSVRSGAPVSMPGMMSTLLNCGATDKSIANLAKEYDNKMFAYKLYRKFMNDYRELVVDGRSINFDSCLEWARDHKRFKIGKDFAKDTLIVRHIWETHLPADPVKQILNAIDAIFDSWYSEEAENYRKTKCISGDYGTAVTVQRMVYGNVKRSSGTAVLFSSDPQTGESVLSGSYLRGRQGEDIVSGDKTPLPIKVLGDKQRRVYRTLEGIASGIEMKSGKIQEIEATWEDSGNVYVLQRRDAPTTPQGRVGFLIREYEKGRITDRELLSKVRIEDIAEIANSRKIDGNPKPVAKGESNGLGIVTGKLNYVMVNEKGDSRILFIPKLTPEYVKHMNGFNGVISAEGGVASHAGVIATTNGLPLVTGCGGERFVKDLRLKLGKTVFNIGDEISIDSNTGKIYAGRVNSMSGDEDPRIKLVVGLARNILQRKNVYYEVQSIESLKAAKALGKRLVYGIDAECLRASGCMAGKPITKMVDLGRAVRRSAMELSDALGKLSPGIPLCIDGRFNQYLNQNGCPPTDIQCAFVKYYAQRSGNTIVVNRTPNNSMQRYGEGIPMSVKIFNGSEFGSNGNVVARSWAQNEDLVALAKEEIAHGN